MEWDGEQGRKCCDYIVSLFLYLGEKRVSGVEMANDLMQHITLLC